MQSTQALIIVTSSSADERQAATIAEKSPLPVIYGTTARIVEAVARWRDEGVDEVIIPDRAMSVDQRGDAYDALADALGELS